MIVIGKRFTFDAAHRLPRHEGKCRRPHGHTYILEVEVTGPVVSRPCSSQGMVIDYSALKAIVDAQVMAIADHYDLNDALQYRTTSDPEVDNVTTAENLAAIFARAMESDFIRLGVALLRVRVQETQNSWAEWRSDGSGAIA